MSKSSKKRRKAAKRRKELERLRGVSLLDSMSPASSSDASPNPGDSSHRNRVNGQKKDTLSRPLSEPDGTSRKSVGIEGEGLARRKIDFVLPRAMGKAETYIFDKQARAHLNEELSTIPEEETPAESSNDRDTSTKRNETLDDIFSSKKRRKLAGKFEAIHKAEVHKKKEAELSTRAPKKRRRSSDASDKSIKSKEAGPGEVNPQSNTSNGELGTKVVNSKTSPSTGRVERPIPTEAIAETRKEMPTFDRQLSGRSVEEAVKDKSGLRPRANSTDGELNLPQRGLCDEHMVLCAHRWKDEQNYVRQVIPRGLVNVGNTCFLNSILQCLAYLPPFCQSLILLSESKARQANTAKKLSQGQRITTNLCNLFQKLHGVNSNALGDGSVAPQAIVKSLPSLGSCGSRNGYKFRPGRQEDAHEFLVHLLDAMHDGELRSAGINQHASGWRDRLPVPRLDETTFIHRIFGGYFRSQIRCKCGYRSNTYDPFLDLSLEVSKKSSNSVQYAISEFTRKERLDADNQWKCSGCKKYVCPTKQLTVFRPPLSLCIQLKRFSFDTAFGGRAFSSFGAGGSWKYGKSSNMFRNGSKITKPIHFPADLDLSLSDGRSCAYTLTGVVIHVGGSASSGHYTAYVKKPGRKGKSQWYLADDSFVEPVSGKTVLRQKDAYILFYCRKEVKLEFPAPPTKGMSAEQAREFGRARAKARADSTASQEPAIPHVDQRHPNSTSNREGNEKLSPLSPLGGPVDSSGTNVHPLAKFLNATMSEQFKTSMAPKQKDKQPTKKENSDSSDEGSSEEGSSSIDSDSESDSGSNIDTSQEVALKSKLQYPVLGIQSAGNYGAQDHDDSSSGSSTSTSGSSPEDAGKNFRTDSVARVEEEKGTVSRAPSSVSMETTATSESKTGSKDGTSNRTRVVVGKSDSRGKVRVLMGPRKRRAWVSKTAVTKSKNRPGFQLLGNLGVSRWDDEDDKDTSMVATLGVDDAAVERERIVDQMERQENSRKRKMHLGRWDSYLDQGKRKKTKKDKQEEMSRQSQQPQKNVFQRIQSGIQRMNRGKAKGLFRHKKRESSPRRV